MPRNDLFKTLMTFKQKKMVKAAGNCRFIFDVRGVHKNTEASKQLQFLVEGKGPTLYNDKG